MKENACDEEGYSLYAAIKQAEGSDDYYYYHQDYDSTYSMYGYSTKETTCIDYSYFEFHPDWDCVGVASCFSGCWCIQTRDDWSPALNDFYTLSAALVLVLITSTSIAFSTSWNQLIYLKLISLAMIFLTIFWFLITMIWDHDTFETTYINCSIFFAAYTVAILYPSTLLLPLCEDFHNFFFLKKFKLAKRVLIENEYAHLITQNSIPADGPWYVMIKPFATNNNPYPKYIMYFKSSHDQCVHVCGHKCDIFRFSRMIAAICILMIYFGIAFFVVIYLFVISTSVMIYEYKYEIPQIVVIVVFVSAGVVWAILAITSEFGRFHFVCFELVAGGICFVVFELMYLQFENGETIDSPLVNYLFLSNKYFGIIDELHVGKQGTTISILDRIWSTTCWWLMVLFCFTSTVLYIKHNRKSHIKGTYMHQLNITMSGTITGILDYLTDILLIMYWVFRGYYVYATIETFFVIIAQIASFYLIDEAKLYLNMNDNVNINFSIRSNNKSTKCTRNFALRNVLLCLGFGRIYYNVKNWNNSKVIEYEYKWSKLLELMFETMPSVMLSAYATIIEGKKVSASIIVSIFFSFLHMTNSIVVILNQDRIANPAKSSDNSNNNNNNENVWKNIVQNHSSQNSEVSQTQLDSVIPEQLWVTDPKTGETMFFAEVEMPKRVKLNKMQKFGKYLKKIHNFCVKFDTKIENFVIWFFLTSDVFLNILSLLSIVIFINYLFINDTDTSTINLINVGLNNIDGIIYATLINLIFLVLVMIKEYLMLKSMISQNNNFELLFKYCFVGIFSNSLYFLVTIGLKYLPKSIDNQIFLHNQKWRITIAFIFILIQLVCNLITYWSSNNDFNTFVFKGQFGEFYLVFACVLVLHRLSLKYIENHTLA